MSSDVIKSFLVELGFKHDEKAITQFKAGIGQATKVVVGFATAVEAAAAAVAIGVTKFASNLESLYFASIRTGTAAASLKAFDRAAQSFGASAGEALSSAEGLARFFRNNPAGGSYVNALLGQVGESAYGANGELKDTSELMLSLGKLFQKNASNHMGAQNHLIADMLGINEKTMLAIMSGEFERKYHAVQKRLNDPAFKHATEGAHKFMDSLRALGDQLFIFGVRVVDVLQDKFGYSLDKITDWMRANGKWLADKVTDLIGGFIDDFKKVLDWLSEHGPAIKKQILDAFGAVETSYKTIKPAMEWMFDELKKLDDATGGWSTRLLVMSGLLKALGATDIIAGILRLGAAFLGLGAGIAGGGLLAIAGPLTAIVALLTAIAGIGYTLVTAFKNDFPEASKSLGNWWDHLEAKWTASKWGGNPETKEQYAVEALTKLGWSPEQAAGITANIEKESSFDPRAANGSHLGIAQWDESGQARYAKWAKANGAPEDMHSADILDQIKFLDADARTSGMYQRMATGQFSAGISASLFSRYYEKPGLTREAQDDEANTRGNMGRGIGLMQTTHITINDAHDPLKAAQAVREEAKKTWAEMTREFASLGIQ